MTNVLFTTWRIKAPHLCFFQANTILWYINQRKPLISDPNPQFQFAFNGKDIRVYKILLDYFFEGLKS